MVLWGFPMPEGIGTLDGFLGVGICEGGDL